MSRFYRIVNEKEFNLLDDYLLPTESKFMLLGNCWGVWGFIYPEIWNVQNKKEFLISKNVPEWVFEEGVNVGKTPEDLLTMIEEELYDEHDYLLEVEYSDEFYDFKYRYVQLRYSRKAKIINVKNVDKKYSLTY